MTKPEISDDKLINESFSKNPYPFWIWIAVILVMTAIYWKSQDVYRRYIQDQFTESPFLHVTNRQMSLFLWQFPHYMRIQSNNKNNYLTGFQTVNRITPILTQADDYVVAPPEVLFLYHTWDRLVKNESPQRPISAKEFIEFINYDQEWQPDYWPKAPKDYIQFVQNLKGNETDIQTQLPEDVRIAFLGWKNFFKEGDQINNFVVTEDLENEFLKQYPYYARNYWQNIFLDYLKFDKFEPFVKVALYNFSASKQGT